LTVREATGAELARVHELLQAYVDELWQRPFPPGPVHVPELDGRIALVAVDESGIVGAAFGKPVAEPGVAHLEFVYVEPASRRNGVGRELVRVFAAAASTAGAEHVTLDVDTSNDVARAVWQRLGFAEWARRLATPLPALVERLEQR
jgi:ribosomal protein S18 acetylase RimI-like enzyme